MSLLESSTQAPPLAPTPFLAPMPFLASNPGPLFGATPDDQALMQVVPGLGGTPTPFASSGVAQANSDASSAVAQMLASLTGGAVASDPRQWTPDMAAAQTDTALAKIAQANPELAKALAEARTGEQPTEEGEDRGFFGDLMHGLGSVLKVTGLSKVFEVLSRPAHIIPELLADEEHDSFWENVGQALTGHSDKGWGQVLDKWDVLQGDDFLSRVLHAGAAFLGDVATDPLTWVMPGTGAIGKEALMRTGASTVFEATLKGTEEGLKVLNTIGRDGLARMWKGIMSGDIIDETGNLSATMIKRLKEAGVADDALPGMTAALATDVETPILMSAVKNADAAARHIGEFGAGALGSKKYVQGLADKLGIPLEETQNMLRQAMREGSGIGIGKGAYEQAKTAAALLDSGIKFRGSIPWFNLRFVTRQIPFTGALNFQWARRFFAGVSGYTRLSKMVSAGEAGIAEWKAFAEDGWTGLRKLNEPLADRLAGGSFLHGGSILYPLSESVGKLTAELSVHAKQLRGGGLTSLIAADAYRGAVNKRANVADAVMTVLDKNGKIMTPEMTQRAYVELFKIRDVAKAGRTEELWDALHAYLRMSPTEEAQAMGAEQYWLRQAQELRMNPPHEMGPQALDEEIKFLEAQAQHAKEAEAKLREFGDDALEGARIHRQVITNGQEQLLRHGEYDDVYRASVDAVHALGAEDGMAWSHGGHAVLHDEELEFVDLDVANRADGRSFGEDQLTNRNEEADITSRGVHARTVVEKPRDMTVRALRERAKQLGIKNYSRMNAEELWHAVRAKRPKLIGRLLRPLVRDLRGKGTGSSQVLDVYAQVRKEAEAALDEFEATGAIHPLNAKGEASVEPEFLSDDVTAILTSEMNREDKIAQIVTERLQSMGHDGIVTILDDGSKHAVFFHTDTHAPVKFLTEDAPRAGTLSHGHVVHQLTDSVVEAVRGVIDDAEGFGASDKFLRDLAKQLQGKSMAQAEEEARRLLALKRITLADGQRVFETDPLKVANRFANDIGKRVSNAFLGRTAQRLDMWGLLDTPFRGEAVGIEKFQYVVTVGEKGFEKLTKASAELARYESNVAKLAKRVGVAKGKAESLQDDMKRVDDLLRQKQEELDGIIEGKQSIPDAGEGMDEAEYAEAAKNALVNHRSRLQRALREAEEAAKPAIDPELQERIDTIANAIAPRRVKKEADAAAAAAAAKAAGKRSQFTFNAEQVGEFNGSKIWRVQEGLYDDHYMLEAPDGRIIGVRTVHNSAVKGRGGSVLALTHPEFQKMGVGGALLKAHWTDAGVFAAEDPLMAAKALIEANSFTEAGAALNKSAVRDLMQFVKNEKSPVFKDALKARAKYDKLQSQLKLANREVSKARTELQVRAADVKPALIPAENARNMTGMQNIDIPGFETVAAPIGIAEEFKRAYRGFKTITGFQREYRKFMSWWKTWATWMFPGFHARNIQGAFFNNLLGGVGISDYVFASRIRRAMHEIVHGSDRAKGWATMRVMEKDAKVAAEMGLEGYMSREAIEHLTYADLGELLNDIGVNAAHGRAFGEARIGTENLESHLGKKTLVESIPVVGKPYVKGMKGLGSMTENLFRTAAWVRGMRNTGDIWGARAFTMMRHGDYADLTDFEYGTIRDYIPFYKWLRTNMPFQIHTLLESPGKLLAVNKARDAAWDITGHDFNKEKYAMPDWMREGMSFPGKLPWDSAQHIVMLDLPMSDLFQSTREFVSSFLPIVRPFIESFVTKQSTFSGAPLDNQSERLDSAFDVAAPFLQALGLASEGTDGGVYVSKTASNLLNVVPLYSRFRNWIFADPDRVKVRANSITSSVFGLGYRPIDDETVTSSELDYYYGTVEPTMEWLKSIGYQLPTKDELTSTVGTTDNILRGLGIDPGGLVAADLPIAASAA